MEINNMRFRFILIFVPISLYFVSSSAQQSTQTPLPECHLKAIDQCIYPGFYFTHRPNTTGIVPNPQEFELMCKVLRKVFKCIDRYMIKCGTDMFTFGYELVKEQILNSFKEFCSDGPMKQNFLKFSPCIHAKVKQDREYKYTCVNNLQAALEHITNLTTVEEFLDSGCCAYNIWEDCINNMTIAKCGEGGDKAVYNLIDKASGGFVHMICKRDLFDPNSEFCKSKMPPPGTQAKGRHSNSIFSKYFTFICPNTGF